MRRHYILMALAMVLFPISIFAQPWMEGFEENPRDFREIQKAFNNYWKDKNVENGYYIEDGIKKKAYGWKQFRRAEWFIEARMKKDGSITTKSELYREWLAYQESNPAYKNRTGSSGNWQFVGPSVNFINSRGIGRLNCIAFHPTDQNTYWVGAPAGGIWKTTNNGTTWTSLTDDLPSLGVSDIAVNPNDPDEIYIATGDRDGYDTYSAGVFKSTNGGATWAVTGLSFNEFGDYEIIGRLLMDPRDPAVLIATTTDGIYRTEDSGVTWTKSRSGRFLDAEFHPSNPDTVYAATRPFSGWVELYRSIDGGSTWTMQASLNGCKRANISVSADDPQLIQILSAGSDDGLDGLFKSTNGGNTITKYLQGNCSNNYLDWSDDGSSCGGQGWYDLSFTLNPLDADEIFLGGINTWSSSNGGSTWSLKSIWSDHLTNLVQEVHADKHFMRFHPLVPNRLFECNDGGLYYSDDHGNTWVDISNGLEISQIYRISTASMNQGNVLCGLQDNGTKEIYNGFWDDRTDGDGMHCIIDYNNNQIQYSSVQNGKLYKTQNHWTNRSTIVSNTGSGVNAFSSWVTPYDLNPSNPQELIIGKNEVYKSTDGGSSWNQLGIYPGSALIDLVYYAPSDPNVIYVSEGTNVVRSDDGGQTWNTVSSGLLQVSSLAIHPTDPLKVWMTKSSFSASDKVSYSSNGGVTWTSITGSLPNIGINTILYEPNSSNGLYIGTDIGVYYKNDNLPDWIPFDNGLPNTIVNDLKISEADGMLYAGTYGRGLWKTGPYQILSADFSTANTTICETACIDFTDNSIGATSWQWNFPGASPSTSTAQNPSGICYSKEGYYPVNLIASNASGSDSKTKVSYIQVEVCASLDAPLSAEDIKIYPNPISDEVWVEFESPGASRTTLRVLDISGRVLFEEPQKTISGLQQLRIDFEEFKKGIYFIELEIDGARTLKKTIKN